MLPDFFHLIGSDRFLTSTEVERAVEPHALTACAWDVYVQSFQAFTGATLDPQFHRLTHPAARQGSVRVKPGTGVLVVGTGPSLLPAIGTLARLRDRVRIFTSPRGAEVLVAHGIVPDLVIVEHQTALDAHHSARGAMDGSTSVLAACPLVAAEARTPSALLAGVPPDSLFVPAPLPTWGLWPATAVAMAIEAGATRIGLLGVDLGTPWGIDPAHAPLGALLGLLARISSTIALDCGVGGASKRNWLRASLGDVAGVTVSDVCERTLHAVPDVGARVSRARTSLDELRPLLKRARELRAVAVEARAAGCDTSALALEAGVGEVMEWRHAARTRVLLQEELGISFLPRLWRVGVDLTLGHSLWRPLLLATHELVAQADGLHEACAA